MYLRGRLRGGIPLLRVPLNLKEYRTRGMRFGFYRRSIALRSMPNNRASL